MDRMQAYQGYWESFQIPAYDETTVPDGAVMPYITYNVLASGFDETLYPSASIWYKGTSWSEVTAKAEEISRSIGLGGIMIPYQNGAIWIKRGQPFEQRLSDTDTLIRRIMLNLEIEFIEGN